MEQYVQVNHSMYVYIYHNLKLVAEESHLDECFADIDECTGESPCHPNAECTNTPGHYTCQCMTGFSGNGATCEGKTVIVIQVSIKCWRLSPILTKQFVCSSTIIHRFSLYSKSGCYF